MTPGRKLLAAVGAASLLALTACDEPSGSVSPSGTNWTVTFYKTRALSNYNLDTVRAIALCHGDTAWTASVWYGFTDWSPFTADLTVYCPTGIAAGSWEEQ